MNTALNPRIASLKVPASLKTKTLRDSNISVENLSFRPVTPDAMSEIWPILRMERGRTTDFSYAGLLMWVDYFKYEYAIVDGTLFIKGVVEDDISKPAFSLPIGPMPLAKSIDLIKEYCALYDMEAEFSAIPEYALEPLMELHPKKVEELTDWADYLYDAEPLATLSGKKMSKKRNHVNKFLSLYPDWKLEPLTAENAKEVRQMMNAFELEADQTEMAGIERNLSRMLIERVVSGDSNLLATVLRANGKVCAYTIGDIKGDTLFIHVEKALRGFEGSYEMINKAFAQAMCAAHPEIEYINREDAAGDDGLKRAKESYHPCELLRKYNVIF